MITIKLKITNEVTHPERELTKEEKLTVFARNNNTENYFYFQKGDESTPEYLAYLEILNNTGEPFVEEKISVDKIDVAAIVEKIQETYILTPKVK